MNFDIIALGELLIDFTQNGISEQGNPIFEANAGGAPCNVLSMLSNLGRKTSFIGVVGDDQFGKTLKTTLNSVGIDTSHLYTHKTVNTTLAFVHTFADGDRDFSFYRNLGADMMLDKSQIDENHIKSAKIFHFGTLSMTHKGVKEATFYALELAKKSDCIISFDPNLRPPLWESLIEAKTQIEYGLSMSDVVKISDDEVKFLTNCDDIRQGGRILYKKYSNIKLLNVTLGKYGSIAFYKDLEVFVPAFISENTIETTGAGDTFCACILHHILKFGLDELNQDKLYNMLSFANAAASIITTRKGALCVMPKLDEIQNLIDKG